MLLCDCFPARRVDFLLLVLLSFLCFLDFLLGFLLFTFFAMLAIWLALPLHRI